MTKITLEDVFELSVAAAMQSGATKENATSLAHSIREAEAEGIRNVGLGFLPYYCDHLITGAIAGKAAPEIYSQSPSVILVDAKNGLAHPAFDLAETLLYEKSRECGLAAISVRNAYYNGVEGYFVRRMAKQGLIGFACTNAVAAVPPFGGKTAVLGTNPLAFAVPRVNADPLVIDLSTSATAFVNVAVAAANNETIPDTWAFDSNGNPTTDPNAGLSGSLQPLGGAKGTGLGLIVEILAAGLSGSFWSSEVPGFDVNDSTPPQLGQFYMAVDPSRFGNPDLRNRLESLLGEMLVQHGVRLPGDNRNLARAKAEKEGVEIDEILYSTIQQYIKNQKACRF